MCKLKYKEGLALDAPDCTLHSLKALALIRGMYTDTTVQEKAKGFGNNLPKARISQVSAWYFSSRCQLNSEKRSGPALKIGTCAVYRAYGRIWRVTVFFSATFWLITLPPCWPQDSVVWWPPPPPNPRSQQTGDEGIMEFLCITGLALACDDASPQQLP